MAAKKAKKTTKAPAKKAAPAPAAKPKPAPKPAPKPDPAIAKAAKAAADARVEQAKREDYARLLRATAQDLRDTASRATVMWQGETERAAVACAEALGKCDAKTRANFSRDMAACRDGRLRRRQIHGLADAAEEAARCVLDEGAVLA